MANIRTGRRSGLVLRGGRNRRDTVWGAGLPAVFSIATGTAVLTRSLNAAALALRPFTVVRVRGLIYVKTDQIANTEQQWVNYGFCVVSDQASAIGVTAVPTPTSDMDSDLWFVIEQVASSYLLSSAVGITEVGKSSQFDSKAMRKVDVGEDLITVVETPATGISEGVSFRDGYRFLLKLH